MKARQHVLRHPAEEHQGDQRSNFLCVATSREHATVAASCPAKVVFSNYFSPPPGTASASATRGDSHMGPGCGGELRGGSGAAFLRLEQPSHLEKTTSAGQLAATVACSRDVATHRKFERWGLVAAALMLLPRGAGVRVFAGPFHAPLKSVAHELTLCEPAGNARRTTRPRASSHSPRRSPPRLLTAAARGGLRPPACTTTAEGHQTNRPGSSHSCTAAHPVIWSSISSLLQRSCSHQSAPIPASGAQRGSPG